MVLINIWCEIIGCLQHNTNTFLFLYYFIQLNKGIIKKLNWQPKVTRPLRCRRGWPSVVYFGGYFGVIMKYGDFRIYKTGNTYNPESVICKWYSTSEKLIKIQCSKICQKSGSLKSRTFDYTTTSSHIIIRRTHILLSTHMKNIKYDNAHWKLFQTHQVRKICKKKCHHYQYSLLRGWLLILAVSCSHCGWWTPIYPNW